MTTNSDYTGPNYDEGNSSAKRTTVNIFPEDRVFIYDLKSKYRLKNFKLTVRKMIEICYAYEDEKQFHDSIRPPPFGGVINVYENDFFYSLTEGGEANWREEDRKVTFEFEEVFGNYVIEGSHGKIVEKTLEKALKALYIASKGKTEESSLKYYLFRVVPIIPFESNALSPKNRIRVNDISEEEDSKEK